MKFLKCFLSYGYAFNNLSIKLFPWVAKNELCYSSNFLDFRLKNWFFKLEQFYENDMFGHFSNIPYASVVN